jgi:hypothetical protein
MYDPIRSIYRFRCPASGSDQAVAEVRLSRFAIVSRLEGPAHPAVFRVAFACPACDGEHLALVAHDHLDYGLAGDADETPFWDPMTGRIAGTLARELSEAWAERLRRGVWPLSFWCAAERRIRPGYPSDVRFVSGREGLLGVAVECGGCGESSLNLVSRRHLDEPFFHDRVVGAVERPLAEIAEIEHFRRELWSGRFDAHRTDLAA